MFVYSPHGGPQTFNGRQRVLESNEQVRLLSAAAARALLDCAPSTDTSEAGPASCDRIAAWRITP